MFGLGMPEILLILAIALIVIGPKKLPDLAKTLGRAMGEFKRSAQDFKRSIDVETTVKDFTDIETPEPNLRDVIKDTETKKSPVDPSPKEETAYSTDTHASGADTSAPENDDPELSQTPPDKSNDK